MSERRKPAAMRHFNVALMHVAGFPHQKIADMVGYPGKHGANRVAHILAKPDVQQQVAALKEQRRENWTNLADKIEAEAGPSIDKLIRLRDGDVPKGAEISRKAANDLLDRTEHFAKKSRVEEDRVVRIVLEAGHLAQMQAAFPRVLPAIAERVDEP